MVYNIGSVFDFLNIFNTISANTSDDVFNITADLDFSGIDAKISRNIYGKINGNAFSLNNLTVSDGPFLTISSGSFENFYINNLTVNNGIYSDKGFIHFNATTVDDVMYNVKNIVFDTVNYTGAGTTGLFSGDINQIIGIKVKKFTAEKTNDENAGILIAGRLAKNCVIEQISIRDSILRNAGENASALISYSSQGLILHDCVIYNTTIQAKRRAAYICATHDGFDWPDDNGAITSVPILGSNIITCRSMLIANNAACIAVDLAQDALHVFNNCLLASSFDCSNMFGDISCTKIYNAAFNNTQFTFGDNYNSWINSIQTVQKDFVDETLLRDILFIKKHGFDMEIWVNAGAIDDYYPDIIVKPVYSQQTVDYCNLYIKKGGQWSNGQQAYYKTQNNWHTIKTIFPIRG